MTLSTYESFNSNETVIYGSPATSASANKGPLFLKKELNALNNYCMLKFGEAPLAWDAGHEYSAGDYCTKDGVIYQANADNTNNEPNSAQWDVIDIIESYRPSYAWNAGTSYNPYDVVIDNNKIYEAINANNNDEPDSANWNYVADVGSQTVGTPDLSMYLAKNNSSAFTPTGEYNPATKGYVDDNLSMMVALS